MTGRADTRFRVELVPAFPFIDPPAHQARIRDTYVLDPEHAEIPPATEREVLDLVDQLLRLLRVPAWVRALVRRLARGFIEPDPTK